MISINLFSLCVVFLFYDLECIIVIVCVTPMRRNIDLLPLDLTSAKKCVQCGTIYVELDNIGRLRCHVHPGVRLENAGGQHYYSCCDRLDPQYGCTQIDHTIEVFTTQSEEMRLNQIQQFSIMILPCILHPYLYQIPTRDRILYELPPDFNLNRNQTDLLQLSLPVLQVAHEKFERKRARDKVSFIDRLSHDGEYDDVMSMLGDSGEEIEWRRVTTFSKNSILKSLYETSKTSELFQKELSAGEERKLRIDTACAEIWKNVTQEDKNKINIIISFQIISRLDSIIRA